MIRKEKTERTDELYKAIAALETVDECKAFFDDICSISELIALEQRYAVARLLYAKHSYNEVIEKTKVSSAIVSRVNRALQYGKGGFEIVFKRTDSEN